MGKFGIKAGQNGRLVAGRNVIAWCVSRSSDMEIQIEQDYRCTEMTAKDKGFT